MELERGNQRVTRTLANRLLQEFPHIYGLSLSHTTRKPRPGEEHGVHYWFVEKDEMEHMIKEGKFVELVTLFGNTYGTSMESIDRVTEQGKVCVMALEMEVDWIHVGSLGIEENSIKGTLYPHHYQRYTNSTAKTHFTAFETQRIQSRARELDRKNQKGGSNGRI
jgi:hypothetical protein